MAPAWDWSADERFDAELAEPRGAVSALRERVAELEATPPRRAKAGGSWRRRSQQLAGAGRPQRRRLTGDCAAAVCS